MTDLSQVDFEYHKGAGQLAVEGQRSAGQNKDPLSVFLMAISLLALLTAFAIGIYSLLSRMLPVMNLPVMDNSGLMTWPLGLTTEAILGMGLTLFAVVLYIFTLWRILHNETGSDDPQQRRAPARFATPIDADIKNDPYVRITMAISSSSKKSSSADTSNKSGAASGQSLREQKPDPPKEARVTPIFGLNLREAPRSDAEYIGLLGPGAVVALIGDPVFEEDILWQEVKRGKLHGWVSSSLLEPIR